jgi:hypothetical protein
VYRHTTYENDENPVLSVCCEIGQVYVDRMVGHSPFRILVFDAQSHLESLVFVHPRYPYALRYLLRLFGRNVGLRRRRDLHRHVLGDGSLAQEAANGLVAPALDICVDISASATSVRAISVGVQACHRSGDLPPAIKLAKTNCTGR